MNSKPVTLPQIIIFQVLTLLFAAACSDSFKEGMEAQARQDYRTAFEKLMPHAKKAGSLDAARNRIGSLKELFLVRGLENTSVNAGE